MNILMIFLFLYTAVILLEHVSRNGISRTKSMCIFKVFIKKKKKRPTYYQDIPEKGYFNLYSSSNSE